MSTVKEEPRVVILTCNWNAHESLQAAGKRRRQAAGVGENGARGLVRVGVRGGHGICGEKDRLFTLWWEASTGFPGVDTCYFIVNYYTVKPDQAFRLFGQSRAGVSAIRSGRGRRFGCSSGQTFRRPGSRHCSFDILGGRE